MKLAYPIGTPDTGGPMLAFTGSMPDMMADLKAIGYTGLEPFVRDPKEMNAAEFAKYADRYGFGIAAVGTGPVAGEDKLTFTDRDAGVREQAVRRAEDIVRFAALFGSQVNIGKLRGDIRPGLEAESWQWMKEALIRVCDCAAKHGVNITLEPQNRFVINNLNRTQQAMAFLNDVRIANLFLMLDIFHMHMEDPSIAAGMIMAREATLHVHFADSNRLVPGQGSIHFPEIVRVMKALNYDRYITIEVEQTPDCRTAAQLAYDHVHRLIEGD